MLYFLYAIYAIHVTFYTSISCNIFHRNPIHTCENNVSNIFITAKLLMMYSHTILKEGREWEREQSLTESNK